MSPTRVGFIGLSTTGWASYSHIPFLSHSPSFTIHGICNTSKASAEAAIKHYSLPPSTKAYASVDELAADPDIDLVVVSVRVDRHLAPVLRVLEHKKRVYVEWPLGRNAAEARQMSELAREKGVKTVVGLQGTKDPVLRKLRQIVHSGRIGRVLSSNVQAQAMDLAFKGNAEGQAYWSQKEVGGNLLTIHFAHVLNSVLHTLGPLSSYTGQVSTQRPRTKILSPAGELLHTIPRTTPDHMTLLGTLVSGGQLTMTLREGLPFKDTPGLVWCIYGERAEIELTTATATFAQIGAPVQSFRLHDLETDEVEDVTWGELVHHGELPGIARNVGALYEDFVKGVGGGDGEGFVDWEEAVRHHELIEGLERASRTGKRIYLK